MKHHIRSFITATLLTSVVAANAMAQSAQPPVRPPIPLKVQVVISRYEMDKKVSSLPYQLAVTANEGRGGSLRMGSMIPLPVSGGGFNMQNVGTNIDCTVTSVDDTRFRVEVSVSDTSVLERRSNDSFPTLRNFVTNNSVILRDGQSAQFTAATDKNTGEIIKVEVSVSIDK